jgi:hypothetical protein
MQGSVDSSLRSPEVETLPHPLPKAAGKRAKSYQQYLNDLAEREWAELPFAMMRLTAASRPWDGKRLYWRDLDLFLDEVGLNLCQIPSADASPKYSATYHCSKAHCAKAKHGFTFSPSLDRDQLHWTAVGASDAPRLTTAQLAEKLLSKLITFYTTGSPKPAATSPASPNPSS